MKGDEYQCAVCKNIYTKGLSDEGAEAEYKHRFDNYEGGRVVVCDDCYKVMAERKSPEQWTKERRCSMGF